MNHTLSQFIRGVLRSSLLNEDDDFSHLQKQIYDKGSKNNGELYDREIQVYLKALKDKFGIIPKQYLGSGNFGYAFLSTDGQTIKITSDKSEVVEARKWKDANPKHLPKVFNIIKIKVGDQNRNGAEDVYVIVKEHILQNPGFIKVIDSFEETFDKLLSLYHFSESPRPKFPVNATMFFAYCLGDKILQEELIKFINFAKQKGASNYLLWYVEQIISIYKELRGLGIESTDTYGKNIGIKNKQLIYIDPGFGDFDGKGWIEKEPYGAEVAQESISEDEDFENFQSDIEQKNTSLGGKLFNRPIKSYLKSIADKLGVTPAKFLGGGTSGYAFLTTDGKTVKITDDKSEVIEAKKYVGKDVKHLPKIYNLFKIKVGQEDSAYCIVKEYVLQNERFIDTISAAREELNYQLRNFSKHLRQNNGIENQNFPTSTHSFSMQINNNSIHESHMEMFLQFLKEQAKPMTYWFAEQFISLSKELGEFNIVSRDFIPPNMGVKNKTLIYLDAGYGDRNDDGWLEKQSYDTEVAQESKNP